MANPAEVKLVFTVQNNAQPGFNSLNSSATTLRKNILALGGIDSFSNLNKQVGEINSTLKSAYGGIAKFSAAVKALGTVGNVLQTAFGGIFDYAKSFQTNAVGISGILTSMVKLNGETLKWDQSMEMSKNIMKELRVQALQTAATSTDLIDTFRGLLGPGLGAGMSVDQIMDFTKVGVNAVKSMGLPTNQYLQELRALIQGNLRASSSTLGAGALGLKDADIKAAKASADGLYKFLMDRLKGFTLSTAATAKTMEGQLAILKEAVYSAGQEASTNILNTYSQTLEKLNNIFLKQNAETGLFEVNPEVIATMQKFADVIDIVLGKTIQIGEYIVSNAKWLAISAGVMYGIPKLMESATNFASNWANKLRIVSETLGFTKEKEVELKEITMSQLSEIDKQYAAKKQLLTLEESLNKAIKEYSKVSNKNFEQNKASIDELIAKWQEVGLTEQQAIQRATEYAQALKNAAKAGKKSDSKNITAEEKELAIQTAKANSEYARSLENVAKGHQEAGTSAEENGKKNLTLKDRLNQGITVVSQFTGALSGIAIAMSVLNDGQDKSIDSMTNWMFAIDAGITAMASMGTAISSLIEWWKGLELAITATHLALLGIAGVVAVGAAAAYGAYQKYEHNAKYGPNGFKIEGDQVLMKTPEEIHQEEMNKLTEKTEHWTKLLDNGSDYLTEQAAQDAAAARSREIEQERREAKANPYGGLSLINPVDNSNTQSGGQAAGGKSEAEKAADQLEKVMKKYESLTDQLKSDIAKSDMTKSSLEKANADILKQDNAWAEEIKSLTEKGVDAEKIKEMTALKDEAISQRYLKAQRDFTEKMNSLNLQSANNTMLLGGTQEEQYKAVDSALQEQKRYYEELLATEGLAVDERIALEQKYAETVKSIRDNNMYDIKTAWQAALQEMSTEQINYGETIKNAFSSIQTAGESLLTSTESFGTRLTNFFSDIASSLISEMSKLIMKALITNVLLKALGIGVGNISNGHSGVNSVEGIASSTTNDIWNTYSGSINFGNKQFASGGYASGWSIVGEQGPELVNFSNPARVYTAQQTANALSGNGGNVNIKIDLKNESGQQLEAKQTGSTFDGENYIVNVVLNAINTNRNGMRSVLRGVANA